MATYKVVDADKLDADLASVADTIRDKSGFSGKIAFPEDYNSGIRDIYNVAYETGSSGGYNMGYQDGFTAGNDEGYSIGYSEGNQAGYNDGYDDGYEEGTKSSIPEDLDSVLTEQEALIDELKTVLQGKASGSGEEVILQSKTITPSKNAQEVTADEGYTALEKVTVEAIPSEYIVPSGTLEITENGTHDVTAYASISVNVAGSGSDTEIEDGIVNRSISGAYTNNRVTKIGDYAFRACAKVTSMSFPKVTYVGTNAVYGCTSLTTVDLPSCTTVKSNCFNGCSKLSSVNLPKVTSIEGYAFRYCYLLTTLDLPSLPTLLANSLSDCRRLTVLILRKTDAICTLGNTSAFTNCHHFHGTTNSTYNPNGDKDGYIYVPSALIDSYKVATNWATFASQFRAIEDYPDICGG